MGRIKQLSVFVTGVVLLVGVLAACAPAAPTPAEVVTIRYGSYMPAAGASEKCNMWLFQRAEEVSKGRLKVEIYTSASLISSKEAVAEVGAGVADVGFVHLGWVLGTMPLHSVTALPAVGEHCWPTFMAYEELCKMPECEAELHKNNLVWGGYQSTGNRWIMTTKPVYKLADLKGMKLQCAGEIPKLLDAIGAVPVTIPYNEAMTALERGTVDGSVCAPAPAQTYGFHEVCSYYYALPTGTNALAIHWNKDSWDRLPADIKKIFESIREEHAKYFVENYEFPDAVLVKQWLAEGKLREVNYPTKEEVAEMRRIAKEAVWSGWVKMMADKGLAGQKVLDKWVELNDKYPAKDPFKDRY